MLRHVGLPTAEAARRVYELYVRHARQVGGVIDRAITSSRSALRRGELPAGSLLRLVCDSGGVAPVGVAPVGVAPVGVAPVGVAPAGEEVGAAAAPVGGPRRQPHQPAPQPPAEPMVDPENRTIG